jgi:hypothetical protein
VISEGLRGKHGSGSREIKSETILCSQYRYPIACTGDKIMTITEEKWKICKIELGTESFSLLGYLPNS